VRRRRFIFYGCVFAAILLGAFLPTDWYWRWPYGGLIVFVVLIGKRRYGPP